MEIDLLTGATTIVRSDLIYDCGQSLNPAVDLGQVSIMCLTVFVLLFSLSEICIFVFFPLFILLMILKSPSLANIRAINKYLTLNLKNVNIFRELGCIL